MISLVLILNFPLLPAHGRVSGQEQTHFEIRLPREIHPEQAQIHYFLTGAFGGYGGFVTGEPGKRAYRIATTVEDKPADTLKALVYAPGCEIVTISILSLPLSSGHADFTCKELPRLAFMGRILSSEFLSGREYEIEVNLLAFWGHAFFGISDGMVTTFRIASVTPDRHGAFALQLPDFTRDAVTKSFEIDASALQFIVRERVTGNILGKLEPTKIQAEGHGMLPLQPDYRGRIVFNVRSLH